MYIRDSIYVYQGQYMYIRVGICISGSVYVYQGQYTVKARI